MNDRTAFKVNEVATERHVEAILEGDSLTVSHLHGILNSERKSDLDDIKQLRVDVMIRGILALAEASGYGGDEYLRQFLAANEYGLARDDLIDHLLNGGEGIPSDGHRDLLAKVDYLIAFDIDKMGAEAHAEVQEVVDEIGALIARLDASDPVSIAERRS